MYAWQSCDRLEYDLKRFLFSFSLSVFPRLQVLKLMLSIWIWMTLVRSRFFEAFVFLQSRRKTKNSISNCSWEDKPKKNMCLTRLSAQIKQTNLALIMHTWAIPDEGIFWTVTQNHIARHRFQIPQNPERFFQLPPSVAHNCRNLWWLQLFSNYTKNTKFR